MKNKKLPSLFRRGGIPTLYRDDGVVALLNQVDRSNVIKRKQRLRTERPHERPYLQEFRRNLRSHLTPAEATLWRALKGSKLDGRKFRRQHSVGNYILDFYCPTERLAVECDGDVHRNEQSEIKDGKRKRFLNSYGIKVLRFENFLIFEDMEHVLGIIQSYFGWYEREDKG
jgi:very-short-patch-repair endonuclease